MRTLYNQCTHRTQHSFIRGTTFSAVIALNAFGPEPLLIGPHDCIPSHPTFIHPFSHFNSYATHSLPFFILTTSQMREIQHNIQFNHNQFLRNSWSNEVRLMIHSNTNSVTSENYVPSTQHSFIHSLISTPMQLIHSLFSFLQHSI
jgi:hypothetical protein